MEDCDLHAYLHVHYNT